MITSPLSSARQTVLRLPVRWAAQGSSVHPSSRNSDHIGPRQRRCLLLRRRLGHPRRRALRFPRPLPHKAGIREAVRIQRAADLLCPLGAALHARLRSHRAPAWRLGCLAPATRPPQRPQPASRLPDARAVPQLSHDRRPVSGGGLLLDYRRGRRLRDDGHGSRTRLFEAAGQSARNGVCLGARYRRLGVHAGFLPHRNAGRGRSRPTRVCIRSHRPEGRRFCRDLRLLLDFLPAATRRHRSVPKGRGRPLHRRRRHRARRCPTGEHARRVSRSQLPPWNRACDGVSDDPQEDWKWPERYGNRPEILQYINHVADRFDLRRDVRSTRTLLRRGRGQPLDAARARLQGYPRLQEQVVHFDL